MKETCKVMLISHLLHDLHGELVVINGNIGSLKYRSKLML